ETYGTTTLVGVSTGQTIATGTATSGNTSNWAMKLETNSSATYPITLQNGYGSYSNVPTTYTKVAERQSATDTGTSAIGSVLTTTYATYVSSTQVADTYNGKVKYTLVHPYDSGAPVIPLAEEDCPANSVCYAPNASDIVGTMVEVTTTQPYLTSIPANNIAAKQDCTNDISLNNYTYLGLISNYETIRLIAPNYSRSGYGFAGWSTDFNATSSSAIYGPNETIDKPSSIAEHGLILYPVWVKSEGNLQDSTKVATLCGSGAGSLTQATYNATTGKINATLSSVTALTDQRDGNTYAIAKLSDGNCWMIENLRLDANNTIGDTNKNLAQGYGTSTAYGNFTGLATSENANFSNTNPPVANSLYSTDGSTTNTIQGGSSSYYYARMPRYNNNNINRTLGASHNGTGSATYYQWYSYGNYYTWASAMASVIEYNSAAAQVNGKTSETANTSLCPAGWRLPYGRNSGNGVTSKGFSYLDSSMGGTGVTSYSSSTVPTGQVRSRVWRSFPNNFVSSGDLSTASLNSRDQEVEYWSSTAGNIITSSAIRFYDTSTFYVDFLPSKSIGIPIRCVVAS
ncbi:hypothetical protein IJG71_00495, partial [Candidatus Saccharibacteria bacterium]|nr:hypothetical protein [Candidatus Saccharibacteria bacterium]